MASITKRGPYQWRARVRRKGYPDAAATFTSREDAEAWARAAESEMDRGVYVSMREAERTTLREAFERYLREITPEKKGARGEKQRIRQWLRHPLADRPLASIRGVDLATYRDERLKVVGASTVRNELVPLSHLYTVARKDWGMEGLVNPVANIRRPQLPRGRDRRLMPGEEEALLSHASYPVREAIILAIETAMRAGEIRSLRWEYVNLTTRIAVLVDTKNGDQRRVPLSTRAAETLRSMPRTLTGRVFPLWPSSSAMSHGFRLVVQHAGIENLRFHDLRHEATSRLFELGLGIAEVSAITGHKTMAMLSRYTHLRAEDLVRKLG